MKKKPKKTEKRGKYYPQVEPILNPTYSKIISILATGANTQEDIVEAGITGSSWQNTYRKRIMGYKIIFNEDCKLGDYKFKQDEFIWTDKEEAIKLANTKSDNKSNLNVASIVYAIDLVKRSLDSQGVAIFTFDWDVFLKEIGNQMCQDLGRQGDRLKGIKQYLLEQVSTTNTIKSINKRSQSFSTDRGWDEETSIIGKKLQKLKRRHKMGLEVMEEVNIKIEELQQCIDTLDDFFKNMTDSERNWLICQLHVYLKTLLWIRQRPKGDKKTRKKAKEIVKGIKNITEWRSILVEVVDFFKAMASPEWLGSRASDVFKEYPFNLKDVRVAEFRTLISTYDLLLRQNLNWLIVLEPKKTNRLLSQYRLGEEENVTRPDLS